MAQSLASQLYRTIANNFTAFFSYNGDYQLYFEIQHSKDLKQNSVTLLSLLQGVKREGASRDEIAL